MQRLVKAWREPGLAGVSKQSRRDQGARKISRDWQQFIVKTYRDGNRGSRRLSAAQVAVRVQVRAAELGVSDSPSRTTVYRILQSHIEKAEQPKRLIGWRGDGLKLHTRDGVELAIQWSNQMWQVDHTRADVLVIDYSGAVLG